MIAYFRNVWKIIPAIFAAVLMATVVYAQTSQGIKGDVTGEIRMKAGAEMMISAEHLITASLEMQDLMKDPTIAKGNVMLTDGEKMLLNGKEMMQHTKTRIEGKKIMMTGSTKMMEGKDFIMQELKKKGLMKTKPFKKEEQKLVDGENMMLNGKNLMMDGERNFV